MIVLSAFAIAQPLFDLLGRGASFFAAHRSGAWDVIALAVVAVLAVPAVLIAVRAVVSAFSARAGRAVHVASVGGLFALAVLAPLPFGAVVAVPLAATGGVAFTLAYRRWAGLRRFLSIVSPAAIVFPVLFLFFSQVRHVVLPQRASASVVDPSGAEEIPVVVVMFDELGLTNIVRPDGAINDVRFPNISRLAERSTWYPDATTVALRTDQAVPAILTGLRTAKRDVPTSFAYPDNLFTLLRGSHEIDAQEFVTQLCPSDICGAGTRGTSGLRPMFTDATIVYLHVALPGDLAERWLPPLGDRWAGFNAADPDGQVRATDTGGGDPVRAWLRSALVDRRESHEGEHFERFLEGLDPGDGRPGFSYMHVQLPHPPWRYLPDGRTYPTGGTTPGYRNFRWSDDQYLADLTLQRSMLQTVYADRLIGDLLDRMEERDILDDSLVIVTSDHGATWDASGTRREIGRGRAAQMVSVPLFVKYPGQRTGAVDRRNAETVDIVPTIADVVGIDVPWDMDGVSLRGRQREGKAIFDGNTIRPIEVSFRDVRKRAEVLERMFGDGTDRDDLFAFGDERGLLGERPADGYSDPIEARFDRELYRDVDLGARDVPAFFRARLPDDAPTEAVLVVVANGRIAGVGQTYVEDGATRIAVMLSPRYLEEGRNTIEVRWVR